MTSLLEATGRQRFRDIIESIRICDFEYSKMEMAGKLGVSETFYRDFVSGRSSIPISKVMEWAATLGHSRKVFLKYALDDLLERHSQVT